MEDTYRRITENCYLRLNSYSKRVVNMLYNGYKDTLNNKVSIICEEILNKDTKDLYIGISNNEVNLCTITQLYEMDYDCTVRSMPEIVSHQIGIMLEILKYK